MEIRLRSDLEEVVEREADMDPVAEAALQAAIDHVPVDTGALRDSLRIEELPDGGRRIVADSDHAAPVEFGTEDMEAQPFLRVIPDVLDLKRT